MVELTKSLYHWLWENHREKIVLIMFGHLEELTDEMIEEYLEWCKTEDGKKYLVDGSEYERMTRSDGQSNTYVFFKDGAE